MAELSSLPGPEPLPATDPHPVQVIRSVIGTLLHHVPAVLYKYCTCIGQNLLNEIGHVLNAAHADLGYDLIADFGHDLIADLRHNLIAEMAEMFCYAPWT